MARPASTLPPVDGEVREFAHPGFAQRFFLGLIRGYQVTFSPLYAGSCRYVPSCSTYALEAVERFGALRGGWLALRRLARCHPLGGHGLDQVPESPKSKTVDL